jgi:hypothetical protein
MITVKDLREKLAEFPDDAVVAVELTEPYDDDAETLNDFAVRVYKGTHRQLASGTVVISASVPDTESDGIVYDESNVEARFE